MVRQVLFAVQNWGLGHAVRSLVLIRALLERGDAVTILMQPGPGMRLLEQELGDTCEFIPYTDMPVPLSRWRGVFYIRMTLAMPRIRLRFWLEQRLTERLVAARGIDLVISDSRFGVWSRRVPSYCITHSLRQIVPGRLRWIEWLVEWGQRRLLRNYRQILIPDLAEDGGLSGDLGHGNRLDWGRDRLVYIGPLADVVRPEVAQDIDYFFSISGPEPQRTLFEQRVLAALPQLQGRIVVTRGLPELAGEQYRVAGAVVHGHLDREQQAAMFNRARVIISRSGYTTLMELATLGKRALFVPTPGQSEQEYLARFHRARGRIWSVRQEQLEIVRDLARAEAAPGLARVSAAASSARFLQVTAAATTRTPAAD
ncbi:MAG TPA: glycosyltransferase [Salinisphaeraceae bacterium]|nr:glycosyltransferase [Salinisphaeraceae bacterium]